MNPTIERLISKNEKILQEYHPSSNKYKRAIKNLSILRR